LVYLLVLLFPNSYKIFFWEFYSLHDEIFKTCIFLCRMFVEVCCILILSVSEARPFKTLIIAFVQKKIVTKQVVLSYR
jgi:hypothetical protein